MHTHPGHPDRRGDFGDRGAAQDRTDRVKALLNLRQDNQSHSRPPEHDDAHEHRPQEGADHGQVLSVSWYKTVKHHPLQDNLTARCM